MSGQIKIYTIYRAQYGLPPMTEIGLRAANRAAKVESMSAGRVEVRDENHQTVAVWNRGRKQTHGS